MLSDAYHLQRPNARTTSVIFASPHSGRNYPASFLEAAVLDEAEIRTSEDAYVDLLYRDVPQHGAPLLTALAPRAFLDLNRGPEEMDAALIDGIRRVSHNPRVASGLGVVPRVVANGRAIYHGKLSLEEAHFRIANYWRPYHDALQTLIDESHTVFGQSILIDCHSMPHAAVDNIEICNGQRPDVVLGDRFGASASPAIVEQVEAAFVSVGLTVARNMPFAGAYIAQHYGRPSRRQHAIQVEFDRALYMNEATLEPLSDFEAVRSALSDVIGQIAEIGRDTQAALAAE